MERPYIVLHMLISIDGKITGSYMDTDIALGLCEEYYRINREYNADAYLCGRVTMEGSFTGGVKPDLSSYSGAKLTREDYVAKRWDYYAVALDPHGRLGWYGSEIKDSDPGYDNAHIIEVLTESVGDEYLAFLQAKGISYIFAGSEAIEVALMLKKLKEYFGINKVMLEGGGLTDTLFLNEEVIDELSIVVVPLVDGDGEGKELFSAKGKRLLAAYKLKAVEQLPSSGLWLNYVK